MFPDAAHSQFIVAEGLHQPPESVLVAIISCNALPGIRPWSMPVMRSAGSLIHRQLFLWRIFFNAVSTFSAQCAQSVDGGVKQYHTGIFPMRSTASSMVEV